MTLIIILLAIGITLTLGSVIIVMVGRIATPIKTLRILLGAGLFLLATLIAILAY